ncbi:hypothetical protein ZIOFF_016472 [Zingiber officinale]|uniref:Dof zinc finger protein n=1 Tax=Zingiber officinale TaxID=94328 RepID=A0A8J5LNA5_ZINOF|nr:hypothetical protein ZIOFF_016472 [Zingiber officinale]
MDQRHPPQRPRYFCKACRRYWTKGGMLRNVPVGGGGCRKSKSSSSTIKSRRQMFSDPISTDFSGRGHGTDKFSGSGGGRWTGQLIRFPFPFQSQVSSPLLLLLR